MGKLIAYNFVSLNGYFKGPKEDISWAKPGSKEESEFAAGNLKSGAALIFGRVTYEMMASYWPTPEALKNDRMIAEGMNKADKIVFSKTLKKAEWNNTKIVKGDIIEEIKKMKQSPGKDMTILGSGSIITQFADHDVIDEYQIMVHPIALNGGTAIFKDIEHKLELKLTSTKAFKSGVVLLCYERAKN
jgi:dihydrofolate reductase